MQSNIVEELNESARRLIWLFNLENESGSIQTIREAAAEITALRDRVAKLEDAFEKLGNRAARAVIAYNVAIACPKGIVPVDEFYDPVIARNAEEGMAGAVGDHLRAKAALYDSPPATDGV